MKSSGIVAASFALLAAILITPPPEFNPTVMDESIVPRESHEVANAEVRADQSESARNAPSPALSGQAMTEVSQPKSKRIRAIPLLLVRKSESGSHDVLRVLLVPRTEIAVPYESLSGGEQRAVRALVGKDRIRKRNAI